MLKIPLRLARPGMRLASAVTTESGLVVLPKGADVDESTLARLESMEVEAISVMVRGPWLKEVAACPGCRQEGQRLAGLFRHHGEDGWMRQVRGVLLAYGSLAAAVREFGSTDDGLAPQEVDA